MPGELYCKMYSSIIFQVQSITFIRKKTVDIYFSFLDISVDGNAFDPAIRNPNRTRSVF